MIISRSVLRMRNVSDKICRQNQNRYVMFNNFSFSKIVPFIRQRGKNSIEVKQVTDENIIRRMRFACRMYKAAHTHTHTQNMQHLLLFHCSNGRTNTLEYCDLRILLVLLTPNTHHFYNFNRNFNKNYMIFNFGMS